MTEKTNIPITDILVASSLMSISHIFNDWDGVSALPKELNDHVEMLFEVSKEITFKIVSYPNRTIYLERLNRSFEYSFVEHTFWEFTEGKIKDVNNKTTLYTSVK